MQIYIALLNLLWEIIFLEFTIISCLYVLTFSSKYDTLFVEMAGLLRKKICTIARMRTISFLFFCFCFFLYPFREYDIFVEPSKTSWRFTFFIKQSIYHFNLYYNCVCFDFIYWLFWRSVIYFLCKVTSGLFIQVIVFGTEL